MLVKEIQNKGKLIIENTKKFKDIYIIVRMFYPISQQNANYGAIICQLLCDKTNKYPSKELLKKVLDNLYDAKVFCSNSIIGNTGVLDVGIAAICGKYVDQDILTPQIDLLSEVLFNPCIDESGFNSELFEEGKENVLFDLLRNEDQPSIHAHDQAMKIFGKGYPLEIVANGESTGIKEVNNHQAYIWYQNLLANNYREIFAIGEVEEEVLDKFFDKFNPISETVENVTYHKPLGHKQEITEEASIDQSQLIIIMHTPINVTDGLYYPLAVGNTLFGQLPTSLLFQEVREKRSLCYRISSRLLSYEGGLYISTGIARENLTTTSELIYALVERMQVGDFNDELIDMAKNMLLDTLRSSYDSLFGYLQESFKILHIDDRASFEFSKQQILAVSKDQIIEAFNSLQLETVYIYQQEKDGKN